MMLNAKLDEVFVITREKLLVGTINIEAIALVIGYRDSALESLRDA